MIGLELDELDDYRFKTDVKSELLQEVWALMRDRGLNFPDAKLAVMNLCQDPFVKRLVNEL